MPISSLVLYITALLLTNLTSLGTLDNTNITIEYTPATGFLGLEQLTGFVNINIEDPSLSTGFYGFYGEIIFGQPSVEKLIEYLILQKPSSRMELGGVITAPTQLWLLIVTISVATIWIALLLYRTKHNMD